MYLLTALLVGINMIYIFGTLKKQKINIADFYVLLGVTIMIYSGIINPPMVGIIGFTVLFLNLLFWNSFIKIINKENLEILFKKYVNCGYVKQMIKEANRESLEKEDVLSDNLYYYNAVNDAVSIVE